MGHVGPNTELGLLDPDGVELDGRTLPAGTYTVEVADSEVGHNGQESCVQGSEGGWQEARHRTQADRPGEVQGRPGAPGTLGESARPRSLTETAGGREASSRARVNLLVSRGRPARS